MFSSEAATQRFKLEDSGSYDKVAKTFDNLSHDLSAPLAEWIVALANLIPGHEVLDVGTGSGMPALAAGVAVSPGGRVVGIDLSERLLERGRDNCVTRGLEGTVTLMRMDAECLRLKSNSFDRVVSLFALLHLPHPQKALAEMHRVLRSGGRLVIAIGGRPPFWSLSGLSHYWRRLPELVQSLAGRRLFAPEPLNSLVASVLPASCPEGEETELATRTAGRLRTLHRLVRAAGFINVASAWKGLQTAFAEPDAFWELQKTISSLARKRLATAPPRLADEVRQRFLERCRQVQARGGTLCYPYGAVAIVAERA